jgi:hypothetical protein
MWRSLKKNLTDLDKDDLLDMIGLESRRSTGDRLVPALALFGAGVLVGVGLGLMLAPKPGSALREDLRTKLRTQNGVRGEQPVSNPAVPAV